MALQVTQVVNQTDCEFCNRRQIAHSAPDLQRTLTNNLSGLPRTQNDSPVSSPARAKAVRARLARQRRARASASASTTTASPSLNSGFSLDGLLSKRQQVVTATKSNDEDTASPSSYRRRVYTMPNRSIARPTHIDPSSCYRLRSFSVTNRGSVVNLGDFVCFRSRSDVNVTSSEGSGCSLGFDDFRDRASSFGSTGKSDVPLYKVLVMGDYNVGKSALIAQFMTSDYLTVKNASSYDAQDISSENSTVSILLDGDEADLDYTEYQNMVLSTDDFLNADAILVTYSVTDMQSFRRAVACLKDMRDLANKQPISTLPLGPGLRSKVVILVGNKCDLARIRTVSTENGKIAANKFEVKFIETSVIIHHNVDELLVGALTQVRLKARQAAALTCKHHAKLTSRARGLWNRLLERLDRRFRSCDNLQL